MIELVRGILFLAVTCICAYSCHNTTDVATKIDLLASIGANITVYMFALHAKLALIANRTERL